MLHDVSPPQPLLIFPAFDAVRLADMGEWEMQLADLEDEEGMSPTVRQFINAFGLGTYVETEEEFTERIAELVAEDQREADAPLSFAYET